MTPTKARVVQIGPAREGQGGISTVIGNILEYPGMEHYEMTHVISVYTKMDWGVFRAGRAKVKTLAKQGEIDLAHVHMAQRGSFLRKASIIRLLHAYGVPTLLHMHGSQFRQYYSGLKGAMRKYCRYIFSLPDCVIALSEDWVPFFTHDLPVKRVEVFPNSVPIPGNVPEDARKGCPVTVLFLGRLGERKGTYDLIEAVRRLRANGYDKEYRLILAGDGEVGQCAALIQRHGLADIVSAPGWIDSHAREEMLRSAHVIALPSYAEGCPMSILEGMSCGLPVLGTAIPSIAAVVRDGLDGFLVDTGDADALGQKLAALIDDGDLRTRMGTSARERIREHFSHPAIAGRLRDIYASMLRG